MEERVYVCVCGVLGRCPCWDQPPRPTQPSVPAPQARYRPGCGLALPSRSQWAWEVIFRAPLLLTEDGGRDPSRLTLNIVPAKRQQKEHKAS